MYTGYAWLPRLGPSFFFTFNRRRESLSSELRDVSSRLLCGSKTTFPPPLTPEDTSVLLRQSYKRTERTAYTVQNLGAESRHPHSPAFTPYSRHGAVKPGRAHQVTVCLNLCWHCGSPDCLPGVVGEPSALNLRMEEHCAVVSFEDCWAYVEYYSVDQIYLPVDGGIPC